MFCFVCLFVLFISFSSFYCPISHSVLVLGQHHQHDLFINLIVCNFFSFMLLIAVGCSQFQSFACSWLQSIPVVCIHTHYLTECNWLQSHCPVDRRRVCIHVIQFIKFLYWENFHLWMMVCIKTPEACYVDYSFSALFDLFIRIPSATTCRCTRSSSARPRPDTDSPPIGSCGLGRLSGCPSARSSSMTRWRRTISPACRNASCPRALLTGAWWEITRCLVSVISRSLYHPGTSGADPGIFGGGGGALSFWADKHKRKRSSA